MSPNRVARCTRLTSEVEPVRFFDSMWMTTVDAGGVETIMTAMDVPQRVCSPFATKNDLELAQISKYRGDFHAKFGSAPYDTANRGQDPPDFRARKDGREWGLDCAAVGFQARRAAENLFERLASRLTNGHSQRWPNLSHCEVAISFPAGMPSKHDASLDEAIAEGMSKIFVDKEALIREGAAAIRDGVMPDIPTVPMYWDERFWINANWLPNWHSVDERSARLGFTLMSSFQVNITEVRTEIERIVGKHDKGGIQQLLLSVGGPGPNGFRFPVEARIGVLLREKPPTAFKTRFIEQITVHDWTTGDVFDLQVER